jgi:hypothetical protein
VREAVPAVLIERRRRFLHVSMAGFEVHSGSPSANAARGYRMRTCRIASIVGICCFLWVRDA